MDEGGLTYDLNDFGARELDMAVELLDKYVKAVENGEDFGLTTNIRIAMNSNSGNVFLTDDDYNVLMVNPETERVEKYYTCSNCGFEGFEDEFRDHSEDPDCLEDIRNQLNLD